MNARIGNIFKSRQTNALLAYRDTWGDVTWDMSMTMLYSFVIELAL